MNPVYEDAAFKLQSEFIFTDGSSLNLGDNLSGGEWESGIDYQVLLIDGVPTPSDLKDLYENVSLQVLVRGNRQQPDREVYSKAYQVMRFFLNLPENTDMNGCVYKGFEQESGLLQLGKDEAERFVYSFNLSTYRGVFIMACDANVTKGRELVVLVRTDDETTFEVIGGVRDRGITFDNPVEEVTSSSTTGEYTESEWTGYSQATINLSGVADKRKGTVDSATGFNITNFERLLQIGTTGNRCGYFKILSVDPNFKFFAEGFFNVTNLDVNGSTPGLLNDTATLQSKADVIVQAGV